MLICHKDKSFLFEITIFIKISARESLRFEKQNPKLKDETMFLF